MKPKVSIIVALYNKQKEIKKCLQSLLKQSLKEIEIIVVNDCSTDKSLEVVKKIKDKRIKVINNRKNKGIGKTRNIGIAHAKGEYVGFVDADDYADKSMYEAYYNFAQNNDLDLLTTDYYKIINGKRKYFKVNNFNVTNITYNNNIINLINYGPCNKLFKKDLILNNEIKFAESTKFEDVIFVAKAISCAHKIGYLNEAYYNYVIHDKSETTTIDERTFDIFNVLVNVNDIYKELVNSEELIYYNIVEITRYMLKQKYQRDDALKDKFIESGYIFLNNLNPSWRQNRYYQKEPFFKRFIKNSKTIMKLYCKIGNRGA